MAGGGREGGGPGCGARAELGVPGPGPAAHRLTRGGQGLGRGGQRLPSSPPALPPPPPGLRRPPPSPAPPPYFRASPASTPSAPYFRPTYILFSSSCRRRWRSPATASTPSGSVLGPHASKPSSSGEGAPPHDGAPPPQHQPLMTYGLYSGYFWFFILCGAASEGRHLPPAPYTIAPHTPSLPGYFHPRHPGKQLSLHRTHPPTPTVMARVFRL